MLKRILELINQATAYDKWLANMDLIDDESANLRVLGKGDDDFILVYDEVLSVDEAKAILKELNKTKVNFIYITGLKDLI